MVNGAKLYKDWHWGVPHAVEMEWEDKDLPPYLIETGRLSEIHYRPLGSNPKRKDRIIKLPKKEANRSHLVFDPQHTSHRLYMLLSPKIQKEMKRKLYKNNSSEKYSLSEIAQNVGGRHALDDYPNIKVIPVGIMTHIVYATEKKGDGMSFYIHHMGEESGIQPALAVDSRGRLWVAGGNYTSPTPGITD